MMCLSESSSMVLAQGASGSRVLFVIRLVLGRRHPSSFAPDPSEGAGIQNRSPEVIPGHLQYLQQQRLFPTLLTTNMPCTVRCLTCTHTACTFLCRVSSDSENESMPALTLYFLCSFHFFFHRKRFPGVYDIDDCAWSSSFEIFQERPGVTTVSVGGVYAFGGEIVEFLEVGIPACC